MELMSIKPLWTRERRWLLHVDDDKGKRHLFQYNPEERPGDEGWMSALREIADTLAFDLKKPGTERVLPINIGRELLTAATDKNVFQEAIKNEIA